MSVRKNINKILFSAWIVVFGLICSCLNGQNLVPNPSFENYGTLPCSWIVPPQSNFTNAMDTWLMPTNGSSDVFSTFVSTSCFAHCLSESSDAVGQQMPRTGDIMSAILTYGTGSDPIYREYLEVMLTAPLIIGQTYYAEMYVSHADYSKEASNNIGMYFSETLVDNPFTSSTLNYTPQINENEIITEYIDWVRISGTFTATTAAQYLVIGNFSNNANTSIIYYPERTKINARYYVDDVSVMEVDPCGSASNDTIICEGSSATLVAHGDSFLGWAEEAAPDVIISADSVLVAAPFFSTTYLAYHECDTIAVGVEVIGSPVFYLGNDTTLCQGQSITLSANSATSYLWSNGSTASSFNPTTSGTYWLEATNNCGTTSDTINVLLNALPSLNLGNDTTLCQGESLTLDATTANASYFWQDNTLSPTYNVTQEGTYWVDVNLNDCHSRDTLHVAYNPLPFVSLGNNESLCEGEELTLNAESVGASYLWQDNSSNSSFAVTQEGMFWVEVIVNNCASVDTIYVNYDALPIVQIVGASEVCPGNTATLATNPSFPSYEWSNGENASVIAAGPGDVTVIVTAESGCQGEATFTVNELVLPTVSIVGPVEFCKGEEFNIMAVSYNHSSLQWNNGEDQNTISIEKSGLYSVTASNECGTASDSLFAQFNDCTCLLHIPNAFTPDGDHLNDIWKPISTCMVLSYETTVFDRWGQPIFYSNDLENPWLGNVLNEGHYALNGVYSFLVKVVYETGEAEISQGHVTLIR